MLAHCWSSISLLINPILVAVSLLTTLRTLLLIRSTRQARRIFDIWSVERQAFSNVNNGAAHIRRERYVALSTLVHRDERVEVPREYKAYCDKEHGESGGSEADDV